VIEVGNGDDSCKLKINWTVMKNSSGTSTRENLIWFIKHKKEIGSNEFDLNHVQSSALKLFD